MKSKLALIASSILFLTSSCLTENVNTSISSSDLEYIEAYMHLYKYHSYFRNPCDEKTKSSETKLISHETRFQTRILMNWFNKTVFSHSTINPSNLRDLSTDCLDKYRTFPHQIWREKCYFTETYKSTLFIDVIYFSPTQEEDSFIKLELYSIVGKVLSKGKPKLCFLAFVKSSSSIRHLNKRLEFSFDESTDLIFYNNSQWIDEEYLTSSNHHSNTLTKRLSTCASERIYTREMEELTIIFLIYNLLVIAVIILACFILRRKLHDIFIVSTKTTDLYLRTRFLSTCILLSETYIYHLCLILIIIVDTFYSKSIDTIISICSIRSIMKVCVSSLRIGMFTVWLTTYTRFFPSESTWNDVKRLIKVFSLCCGFLAFCTCTFIDSIDISTHGCFEPICKFSDSVNGLYSLDSWMIILMHFIMTMQALLAVVKNTSLRNKRFSCSTGHIINNESNSNGNETKKPKSPSINLIVGIICLLNLILMRFCDCSDYSITSNQCYALLSLKQICYSIALITWTVITMRPLD